MTVVPLSSVRFPATSRITAQPQCPPIHGTAGVPEPEPLFQPAQPAPM